MHHMTTRLPFRTTLPLYSWYRYCPIVLIAGMISLATFPAFAQQLPDGFSRVAVSSGLNKPTVVAFSPDGRIFVAQQGGALRVIKNGSLLSTPFVSLNVNASGERGLIGVVLHPDFPATPYVYLYHTLPDGSRNRISRFTANGDVAVSGSEQVVLNLDPLSNATNHNGGAMHFGADGTLYVAVGENATPSYAQNLDTYHGKLLRINPDGSVPTGNPFTSGSEQKRRVWAYGLRNPYTFDIEPGTGTIYVNDVGQNTWEEVNNATVGGRNFGWPAAEGVSSNTAYTNPVHVYPHGSGDGKGCAITGGVFFSSTNTNYPAAYAGRYFLMDYCNSWINMLDRTNGINRLPFATGVGGSIVSLEVGTDGNLYYLSRSSGTLYKVTYTNVNAPAITNQPEGVSVTEGQPASFQVSASGSAPLAYQWQKNGTSIFEATTASYTLPAVAPADAGSYRVVVSNGAGSVTSQAATLTVTAFNSAPVAQIITPTEGTLYRGGQSVSFTGEATDNEDGTLPASAFVWEVVFHHATHTHDGPPVASDTKSGSFVIPNQGEVAADVWYRLYLTVTDSEGLSTTIYRDIFPRTSTIHLATVPAGLSVSLDGQPKTTPTSVIGVEGILRAIGASGPQTLNGLTYTFDRWQHGGSAQQTITTPAEDVTYTAVFTTTPAPLPAPWASADIGAVATAGSASFTDNIFTVRGSGQDIWQTADEFHYVYQALEGNGEIVAKVSSIGNTDAWAKAGLMIRESTAAGTRHASMFITPSQGLAFQRRTSAGGASEHTGKSGSAPVWLKLVREGDTFKGSMSSDGSAWQPVGTATISLPTSALVGLAVTSHNDGVLATSVFEQVAVSRGAGAFEPLALEAEQAKVVGGVTASSHSGYTGDGFVDYLNPTGDYIEWTVNVPATDTYSLGFRYALGSSSSRPLAIGVNGVVVASSLAFPSTGSWTNWQTVTIATTLQEGSNTVRTTATGSSGANVDHLAVSLPLANVASNARTQSRDKLSEEKVSVQVFPNPATDYAQVSLSESLSDAQFYLTDTFGRKIRLSVLERTDRQAQVSLADLPSGLYLLTVETRAAIASRKIVVSH